MKIRNKTKQLNEIQQPSVYFTRFIEKKKRVIEKKMKSNIDLQTNEIIHRFNLQHFQMNASCV